MNSITRLSELAQAIGVLPAFEYALKSRYLQLRVAPHGRLLHLSVRSYPYPLYARFGTSDLDVFEQVFVKHEYECLPPDLSPRLIVDCGAYVGYSSVYFLNRFPSARVIAIEPDANNAAVCRQNLQPYAERASVIHAAVWSHSRPLALVPAQFRDGREWAAQVRECRNGEPTSVDGIDLGTLLSNLAAPAIDLLKVDIEGAETQIFSDNVQRWLPHTKNLVIELHGTECEAVFFAALAGYRYQLRRHRELTVCTSLASLPRAEPPAT